MEQFGNPGKSNQISVQVESHLRRWPSRLRPVCQGESSYRYALRIKGAQEQLNLFPIAQLGQLD